MSGFTSTPVCISYSPDNNKALAMQYAQQLAINCVAPTNITTRFYLQVEEDVLTLHDAEKKLSIHVDFLHGSLAHRKKYGGGRGQTLAKAIGLKQGVTPPRVLDVTCGLAKDAYVLASLGCSMTLIERSPYIAALVEDAIRRASEDSEFQAIQQHGFNLLSTDAIDYLKQLQPQQQPEIIYIDPMYPERKKSASVKKNMQVLQNLLGHDLDHAQDNEQLLELALQVATRRVVVKRPKGAPQLSTLSPTLNLQSKTTRYDIYVIQKL